MTSTSTSSDNKEQKNLSLRHFPQIINGRINMIEFVNASTDLVTIVERLGAVFAPVKYDMQSNMDKIKTLFTYDENSCLLELMQAETAPERPGAESVLWLNKALLFFEIVKSQLISHMQSNNNHLNMKQVFTVAYEGSCRRHHNWVIQEIFNFICKVCPTLPQVYEVLGIDGSRESRIQLERCHTTLHSVRCKIDDFFKDNSIFVELL